MNMKSEIFVYTYEWVSQPIHSTRNTVIFVRITFKTMIKTDIPCCMSISRHPMSPNSEQIYRLSSPYSFNVSTPKLSCYSQKHYKWPAYLTFFRYYFLTSFCLKSEIANVSSSSQNVSYRFQHWLAAGNFMLMFTCHLVPKNINKNENSSASARAVTTVKYFFLLVFLGMLRFSQIISEGSVAY